ncbi:DUF262 domain-containing protein [Entomomonas asaccharolytica]|uniref:DUF262 domain-containing protein n=1 Tax=Entomomonas asaccharolytica TaxID=2785331 RepID=A0A974NE38_9GAMM|nr:DUF262 domain-containing protein [Entomomonas asaccharolytica]QQP84707.1 DUF262 domain-containing protein [Entomomonas asaccharolytica]
MIKSANQKTVLEVLGKDNNKDNLYRIPDYQREYSWNRDNWDNLYDDLRGNEDGYFLGSIICIVDEKEEYLELIDGQQRLTSISLLLMALYEKINDVFKNHDDVRGRIQDDIDLNANWTSLHFMLYISKKKKARLILSMQNKNYEDYNYLIQKNFNKTDIFQPQSYFSNRRLAKAYSYFYDRLGEFDNENKFKTVEDLFDLLDKIMSAMLVKIDVGDISSAFILFESLNNRGMPLTPIDLIKSSIIGRIGGNPNDSNKRWQIIINNVPDYPNQERFLRHYYHAYKHRPEIAVKNFPKPTKSNLIKIYGEHINKNAKFIFNELINQSEVYKKIISPELMDTDDNYFRYREKLIDLKRLGVVPANALILYLFSQYPTQDHSRLLDYLEAWFIRRQLTNYPATNKLDQIFIDIIEANVGEKYFPIDDAIKQLNLLITNISDEDFVKNLTSMNLYEDYRHPLRYLLIKLEKMERTKEGNVDFDELDKNKKPIWTIEHIYPQKPKEILVWNFTEEDREKYLHSLGNLTLTCYNNSLSNKSFEEKYINIKDSNGKDIGLKSGTVKINNFLLDVTEWLPEHVEKRGKQLAMKFAKLFKI